MENENKDNNVRVMSKSESASYEGITIDEGSNEKDYRTNTGGFRYDSHKSSGIHIKMFSWRDLLLGSGNTLTRIAVIVALIAILGFLLFAVLPIAIVIVAIGIVVYFVMQLLFN